MTNIVTHPYHLVNESPWPLLARASAGLIAYRVVQWFQCGYPDLLIICLISTILVSIKWWEDVSKEGTLQGLHTAQVENGLRAGIVLFILSEVILFFSFFWAFFHSSLIPTFELGSLWPPTGIVPFSPFQVPLLNTVILLSSGVSLTWSHHCIIGKEHRNAINALILTIVLGAYFTCLQILEYKEARFSLADRVYGSIFFLATGFHGAHVLIGSTFLTLIAYRLHLFHFSSKHHFGFEAAAWYWHFVDVVWLFLYMVVYYWGGN